MQAYRHVAGCMSMVPSDIILASFPRSGSTWFRTVFANALNLKAGIHECFSFKDLPDVMPALGYSRLGWGSPEYYQPRLIRTHRLASQIIPFRPQKVLHLWREPEGVMKSSFRYYSANRNVSIAKSCSEFVRDPRYGMPAWRKHYDQWALKATTELRYTDFRKDTVKAMDEVYRSLDYHELLPFVAEAVELASLEHMKKSEAKGMRNPERFEKDFNSIGGSKDNDLELSEADVQYIRTMSEGIEL